MGLGNHLDLALGQSGEPGDLEAIEASVLDDLLRERKNAILAARKARWYQSLEAEVTDTLKSAGLPQPDVRDLVNCTLAESEDREAALEKMVYLLRISSRSGALEAVIADLSRDPDEA